MSDKQHVDLLIIGGGEAGKNLAWAMAKVGQSVAVVERKPIGGSCPNIACLPSKNIIHSAKVAQFVRRAGQPSIHPCRHRRFPDRVRQPKRRNPNH
jgi:pyruvate/2-oxoglutarate dehydrogenase complex dihydrolipoamide dehydrogenase (E3) component